MPEENRNYTNMEYSYLSDQKKKKTAFIVLFTASIIFFLTLTGVFDGLSNWIETFLVKNLGYTNKWSTTFGPTWFNHTMNDISSLAGKPLIFIGLLLILGYYKIIEEKKSFWKFLRIVIGGIILLQLMKLFLNENASDNLVEFFVDNISGYPSGHAMIGMIFFLTLAVFIIRRRKRYIVRKYIIISSLILIFLIGVSRVLGGNHTFNEVLAGWSAGLIWLCICWLIERYKKKLHVEDLY